MARGSLSLAAAALAASIFPSIPASAVSQDVDALIRRVGEYVANYGERASLIVGVEDYTQRYSPAAPGEPSARHLVSEFALVKTSDATGWAGWRDVVEVDGTPVTDRRDRLQTLFRASTSDAAEARRIADESARYNIGPIVRNLNVPTSTLFFFAPANLWRFKFARKGQTILDGMSVWEVEFNEKERPTFIKRPGGQDVPSHGTLWVLPESGIVVRTRLSVRGFMGSTSMADIDVRYEHDARLEMWLPATMTERYEGAVPGRHSTLQHMAQATATATYSDFKRFETAVKVSIR